MDTTRNFSFFLTTFLTIFVIVDPFGAAAIFLSITPNNTEEERKAMAKRAAIVAALVLFIFAVGGNLIFKYFGITLDAFKVAGGVLLCISAINMLYAKSYAMKHHPEEAGESVEKEDISIVPLAVPILAGPGAITAVMIDISKCENLFMFFLVFLSIALVCSFVYIILREASLIIKFLGKTGINITTRFMGLILISISVQFIVEGIIGIYHNYLMK